MRMQIWTADRLMKFLEDLRDSKGVPLEETGVFVTLGEDDYNIDPDYLGPTETDRSHEIILAQLWCN